VLWGPKAALVNEGVQREEHDANDYYRSKILADREVDKVLKDHPDMWTCMVLPGWMFGPGDIGPTSSDQLVLEFLQQNLQEFHRPRSRSSMRVTSLKRCSNLQFTGGEGSVISPRDAI
jgi:hypothetical protein